MDEQQRKKNTDSKLKISSWKKYCECEKKKLFYFLYV